MVATIGILALQGDVREHRWALESVGAGVREVRERADLDGLDGLIIPGGESTTVGKLLTRLDVLEPLRQRIHDGLPVYGTCTGMILLAKDIEDGLEGQPRLAEMDLRVCRNGFGRQRESFEAAVRLALPGHEPSEVRGVFIRAPRVVSVGPAVEVLGTLDGQIVAVRQGRLLATSFHPELTGDSTLHAFFTSLCVPAACP